MDKHILNRIFQGLFFSCFLWIYASIIFTNSGNKPWISLLAGIVILISGIGIAYFCKTVVIRWRPQVIHIIFAGISVIILTLLIYFAFSLKSFPDWDAGGIYQEAIAPFTGKYLSYNYFAIYPNNIFLFLIYKIYYKMIFFITGSTDIIYIELLNVAAIFISIIFLYLIAVKLWGAHMGLFTGIICLFFAPFYTYTAYYYTDSFSLPFVTISIYLYLCAVNSKKEISKYLSLIGAGIILALGFKLKATIAIILVAIVIHLFLNQKIRTALIYIGVTIASFIVVLFSYNAAVKQLNIVSEEEAYSYQMPYTHWLMMGLTGDGGFNLDDVKYTQSFPNIDEKKAANIEVIKQRLSDYGFVGTIKHMTNKAVHNTWGDGTYFVFREGTTIKQIQNYGN